MAVETKVTIPEWKIVHAIADAHTDKLTAALIEAWDALRARIHVEDLGQQLSLSGLDNIQWKYEIIALQGAMVNAAGPIARDTALALLPRLEGHKSVKLPKPETETFADWIDLEFDLRFMSAEHFLEQYLPMLIVKIDAETRRAIRDVVLDGFQHGKHPYQMAEEIQAMVGMTPGQVRAYRAFASNLAKGNLSAKSQDLALARYRERAIERRARNIARTETIRAANAGQMMLWRKAADNGLLVPSAKQVWIATPGSSRTCPYCMDLNGKTTRVGGVWQDGITQPPAHPSCRCAMGLEFD